ncbi:MAG: hypothetical protein A3J38_06620 [Gammaproteobacteria bacterium RIFCSPHIGHO2_12_FULL_45_9]|nr:MAG: hypothetical protein A3J38_06620 [Gammaproteobacteria bacterium RIFCSPHIGHO2_12_FULL_45_9]
MMISAADLQLGLGCVVAGLVAGYIGALFGVGGGTVLVPAMLLFFAPFAPNTATVMHTALGTSLALIIPNGLMAALHQIRSGALDYRQFKQWVPFVMGGAVVGAILAHFCSADALKGLFTGYLFASAAFGALKHRFVRQGEIVTLPHAACRVGGPMIGMLSVLLGIGGGAFIVPFCQALRYPIKKAIALSSATTVVVGVVGAIGAIGMGWHVPGRMSFSWGYVNWLAFLLVMPFIVIASPWGVRTANRLPPQWVHRLYTVFLLTMGISMLV